MSNKKLYRDNYWSHCMNEINKKYKLNISQDTSCILKSKFIKIGCQIFYARPFIAIVDGWYQVSIFINKKQYVLNHLKIKNEQ